MSGDLKLPAEVSALITRLGDFPFVTEVVLFGSRARRDNRPDSDFDLLVFDALVEGGGLYPEDRVAHE